MSPQRGQQLLLRLEHVHRIWNRIDRSNRTLILDESLFNKEIKESISNENDVDVLYKSTVNIFFSRSPCSVHPYFLV
jgi:hypothetical protein